MTSTLMLTLTVSQAAALQYKDMSVCERYRGAPILKAYSPHGFLGKHIAEVTHEDFRPILADFLRDRPPTHTGYRLVSDFNALMKWATEYGLRREPYKAFKTPDRKTRVVEILSPATVEAILNATDALYAGDLVIRIAVRSMAMLGLGVGDTANFSLDKVDFERWEYVHSDGLGRIRLIPIPHPMRVLIAKVRQFQPNGGKHKRHNFKWLSDQTLRNLVRRIGQECGLPNLLPIQIIQSCLSGGLHAAIAMRKGGGRV